MWVRIHWNRSVERKTISVLFFFFFSFLFDIFKFFFYAEITVFFYFFVWFSMKIRPEFENEKKKKKLSLSVLTQYSYKSRREKKFKKVFVITSLCCYPMARWESYLLFKKKVFCHSNHSASMYYSYFFCVLVGWFQPAFRCVSYRWVFRFSFSILSILFKLRFSSSSKKFYCLFPI